MYSGGTGHRLVRFAPLQQPCEVGAREAPLERPGDALVVGLEGEDALGERLERGGIGGHDDLALQDAEEDLDLVGSQLAWMGRCTGTIAGYASVSRATEAVPRCEVPLSSTQYTRRAER
jgi:hypothetical protein